MLQKISCLSLSVDKTSVISNYDMTETYLQIFLKRLNCNIHSVMLNYLYWSIKDCESFTGEFGLSK